MVTVGEAERDFAMHWPADRMFQPIVISEIFHDPPRFVITIFSKSRENG
jgi:hypothetical protein